MQRWQHAVAIGFMLATISHAVAGFLVDLPAWQMFAFIHSR